MVCIYMHIYIHIDIYIYIGLILFGRGVYIGWFV